MKSLFPIPVPPERRRAARPDSGTAPRPTKKRPTQAKATKKRPTGPTQAKAADVPGHIVVAMLSTDLLDANDFNANEMTPDQLAGYRTEVQRLGRLPKPVVVRTKGDRYEVIDGEHGLLSARDLHLLEVPCEIIQADDFEAILQNYKRNQHGARNPVKQGLAFERLQQARRQSNRKLAEALGMPEATLRTYLDYARAFQTRNGCAPHTAATDVAALSVKQVRQYLRMADGDRDAWLEDGAVLDPAETQTEQAGDADSGEKGGNETTNATTDDEKNADRSQDEEQSGQEQDEADAAEASDTGKGRAPAETKDDATDNFDDVLQGLTTAASTLARCEGPLTGLLETLTPQEKNRIVRLLEDISRLAGRMVGLCVEDQPTSPPPVV
jgi:ParB-like chromosome segregation protein Spo0J